VADGEAADEEVARVYLPDGPRTHLFPGYARALPYHRSGREQLLMPIKQGARSIWAGDGSQWLVMGHD
jgi:hypothetical protein